MTKTSPLFKTYGRDAKEIYVHYAPSVPVTSPQGGVIYEARPSTGSLKIGYHPVSWDDAIPVSSIEEAEKLFLNKFMEITEMDFIEKTYESSAQLSIAASRGSNLIASRTRLGLGNTLLAGKTALSYITDHASASAFEASPEVICGGWIEVGKAYQSVTIYTSDLIPEDEIMVIYNGGGEAVDGPAALLVDGDEMRLHFKESRPDGLGEASDFVYRLRMKII